MSPKNKIILFYPKIYEGFVEWHRAPLSLMAVARMVEKEFDVEIIDERVDKKPKEKVADIIQECLCFGITALTGSQIKYALGMAKFVKENAPSIPIVWGGWHPSVVPEQTAMHPLVDIVVRGQGELSFREIVKALSFNKPLADIPGITYKENNTIVSTPDRPFCDVNEFPPMPYHLVNVENYIGSPPSSDGARIISYISSQGCPHRCAFCSDSRVYKRKWSGLRAELVVDELEKLSRTYNIEGFFFEDSNFFGSLERVRAICKEITKRKLAIKWEAEVRTEKFVRADKELKDMIKRADVISSWWVRSLVPKKCLI